MIVRARQCAALALGAASAFASDWDAIVTAANDEGEQFIPAQP
jgi:hypothetical protein